MMTTKTVTTRSSAGDDEYFLTTRTITRIPTTTTSSCCSSAKTKGLSNSVARFERRQKRSSSQLSRQTLQSSIYRRLFFAFETKMRIKIRGRDFERNGGETYTTTLCSLRYRSRILSLSANSLKKLYYDEDNFTPTIWRRTKLSSSIFPIRVLETSSRALRTGRPRASSPRRPGRLFSTSRDRLGCSFLSCEWCVSGTFRGRSTL